jgi:tripartite-type tricarboxylate transporter receptor subunit TctC
LTILIEEIDMNRIGSKLAAVVATTLSLLAANNAMAQTYPVKPVKIIVPFPPGQGTDVATRFLAARLTKALGHNFLVENRPGAGASLGTEVLAKSAPDGYTLGIGTAGTHTMNPSLYPSVGYDPEKDFEPITLTGMLPLLVAAHPAFPANSIQELIALAKAKPDSINVALTSPPQRVAFEMLRQQGGAPLFGIPYKGSATALPEVMSGQVPVILDSITALRPHVNSGKLKALGVTSANATELMPGVKSVAQQGLPGYELTAWNAVFAPKGTPQAIVMLLNVEVRKILDEPETRQSLMALGFEVTGSTPQELADRVKTEREKWSRIIRTAKITVD